MTFSIFSVMFHVFLYRLIFYFDFCFSFNSIIVSCISPSVCKSVLAIFMTFWTIFLNILEALKSKFCLVLKPIENSTFQSTRGCHSDRRGRGGFMDVNYLNCLVVLFIRVCLPVSIN